jgi:putative oxygen-independent coproporphyrinogen III oxidase
MALTWAKIMLFLVLLPLFYSANVCASVKNISPKGAYLHIPFCRRRCYYCNFDIVTIGDRPNSVKTKTMDYAKVLMNEIKLTHSYRKKSDLPMSPLQTIYFGGGTPSLLEIESVSDIIATLSNCFGIAPDAEITLEMDPGTFDLQKLLDLKHTGINRISLGIQSFDADVLKKCGRAHTASDSQSALKLATDVFPRSVSVDLISSLPGLDNKLWEKTLETAVKSGASHISVYDLQVEERTAFGRWYEPGVFPLPSVEESADMYKIAHDILTHNNFEHYEVSNYARLGTGKEDQRDGNGKKTCRSRHNQQYWQCASVYGFGMAAASFTEGKRVVRPTKMKDYVDMVHLMGENGYWKDEYEYEEDVGRDKRWSGSGSEPDVFEVVMHFVQLMV